MHEGERVHACCHELYSQVCTALDPRQGVPAPGTPEVQKEAVRQAIEIICIQRSETKLLDRVEKPGTTHVVACAQGQAMWLEARRVPVGALALAHAHARPTCHPAQLKANFTSWHRLRTTAYNPERRTLTCAGKHGRVLERQADMAPTNDERPSVLTRSESFATATTETRHEAHGQTQAACTTW
jgi:hypothetical protein